MPDREVYTASVISYLQENRGMLESYFEECQAANYKPSYSNLLNSLDVGDRDGVNLASSYVMRSIVTDWIVDEYVLWLVS